MKYRDLSGMRIGKLTVIEPTEERIRNAVVWKCKCDCGNEVYIESRRLKPGVVYSCGCEKSPDIIQKNLAGLHFGKLTVLRKSGNKAKDGNPLWLCQCECGNVIETTRAHLIRGNTRSCGCGKQPPLKDWVGKRFGSLTVLSYARKEKGFHVWHCRCDCGKEVDVRQSNLQSGTTKSCGCRRVPQKGMHYTAGTCLEMLRSDMMYKTNTSGVKGVYYSKKRDKWIAQIMFKQKCYYLGGYERIEDAAEARKEAEKRIFGDFLIWYQNEFPKSRNDKIKNSKDNSEEAV